MLTRKSYSSNWNVWWCSATVFQFDFLLFGNNFHFQGNIQSLCGGAAVPWEGAPFHFLFSSAFGENINFHFWEISQVLVVVQSLGKEQPWQQMICASGLSHLFLLRLDHRDGDSRVRKSKNFPDSKIFTAKSFRIKCANCDNNKCA